MTSLIKEPELLRQAPTQRSVRQRVWPIAACLASLAAILAANPFNGIGFDDDWSYGRVAMHLADAGRLHWNGWGGALILVQCLWTVPWIRLFGFSPQILQAATIPFAMGFVLLVYASARQLGISRDVSTLIAFTSATSPLFLPFAASFMTEAYSSFFFILCFYFALRALNAASVQHRICWIWLLAASGFIGGCNRQTIWLAPMALIPWLAWTWRTDRSIRLHSCMSTVLIAIGAFTVVHFFAPSYPLIHLTGALIRHIVVTESGPASMTLIRFLLLAIMLSTPAFFLLIPRLLSFRPLYLLLGIIALLPVTFVDILLGGPIAPFGNNLITVDGLAIGDQSPYGATTVVVPVSARVVLTSLTLTCLASLVCLTWRMFKSRLSGARTEYLGVVGVLSGCWLASLVPNSLLLQSFDRYIFPLVPLFMIYVVLVADIRRSSAIAWCAAVILAVYAIAATHDYFAGLRTREELTRALERNGVAANRISAGFEHDGWVQLTETDYAIPPQFNDAFVSNSSKGFWFPFWNHLNEIQPDYVVLNWLPSGKPPNAVISRSFQAWLPIGKRTVGIWKRSELTAELQAARIIALRH